MCRVNTTRCPKWCTSCYFCDHDDFFSVYISCTFYFFPKEVNIWFDVIHLSTRCCIKSPFLDIPNSRTLPILMQFEILKCIVFPLDFLRFFWSCHFWWGTIRLYVYYICMFTCMFINKERCLGINKERCLGLTMFIGLSAWVSGLWCTAAIGSSQCPWRSYVFRLKKSTSLKYKYFKVYKAFTWIQFQ